MESREDLLEAKRQIESTVHKLRETLKTLEEKPNAGLLKSQITLATRRIAAFELALRLIERELAAQGDPQEALRERFSGKGKGGFYVYKRDLRGRQFPLPGMPGRSDDGE